jgi:hypothetical protein
LRRFGLVGNKFLFETKPTDGADVFLFLCSQRIRLNEMFKLAAVNQLHEVVDEFVE